MIFVDYEDENKLKSTEIEELVAFASGFYKSWVDGIRAWNKKEIFALDCSELNEKYISKTQINEIEITFNNGASLFVEVDKLSPGLWHYISHNEDLQNSSNDTESEGYICGMV